MIRLAIKNLLFKPLNLALSLILFSLGVGLISFLLLFNRQLSEKFNANLANIDLVIGAKGSPLQLILCNMYHIDNPTGNINIKDAKAFLNPRHPILKTAIPLSLGDNYQSYRIIGTNHDFLKLYNARLQSGGLWIKDLDVVVGHTVAQKSGLKIGSSFVSSHGFDHDEDLAHDHAKFKVTGILDFTGSVVDQLILTNTASIWEMHAHGNEDKQKTDSTASHSHTVLNPLDTVNVIKNSNLDLLRHPENQITSILVQYKSKKSIQALNMPRAINENTAMQAASPPYEINKLFSMIGTGTDAITYIALLIGLVSIISIFISLYGSMKERKYELSLMRVLGSSRQRLFGLILIEGLLIAIAGWILGIVMSHLGLYILGHHLSESFKYSFSSWQMIADEWVLLGISVLIGIVAAIIPAIAAAKTDIHKTLTEK